MEQEILEFKFEYTKPIELAEFSESLKALANQFERHCLLEGVNINEDEIKLYIHAIESGSIVAKCKALGRHLKTITENEDVIRNFLEKAKKFVEYLLSQTDEKPNFTVQDLDDYAKIFQPTVNDGGASLIFVAESGSNQNIVLHVDSLKANAIQNRIAHEKGMLKLPNDKIHRDMLYYCYQARDDARAKTGDMGIIEELSQNPVKTHFSSEEIKRVILEDPFKKAFVVSVHVQYIAGVPKLYKILEISDVIDR